MRLDIMNGWKNAPHRWVNRKFWFSFEHMPGYATAIGLLGFVFWFF
jgi:hypothetical protein